MRTILNLVCLIAGASAIHTHIEPQNKWPDIGEVVDKAKHAANSAEEAAKRVNSTVQNSVEQAANTTKTAIQAIVAAARAGLQSILEQGQIVTDHTEDAIDGFIGEVQHSTELQTFGEAGVQMCDAFGTLFTPLVLALRTSSNSVQKVLTATGFLQLSQAIGKDLEEAMVPINATLERVEELKRLLQGLKDKINNTLGKIPAEVENDFDKINQLLQKTVKEVEETFTTKMTESYDLLVKHLRATVEGALPQKYLDQVNASLITIEPMVAKVAEEVANLVRALQGGFETAIHKIHDLFPSGAHNAAILSLSLAMGICISWFTL